MKKEINTDLLFPNGAEVNIIPVMQGMEMTKVNTSDLPKVIPLLALRNAVVFPGMVFPVTIGREKSINVIRHAEKTNSFIGAVPQTDLMVEDPGRSDLFDFGTVCRIVKVLEMPDGTITALLQGLVRFNLLSIVSSEPFLSGNVVYLEDINPAEDDSTRMIAESLKEKAANVIRSSSMAPKEAFSALKSIDSFPFLVNFIATTIEIENFNDKVDLLRYDEVKTRAMKLLSALDVQSQLLKIKQEINQKVKSEIDQQQREYYLNNQLKTIQEELGMDDESEFETLRAKARTKKWPESVAKQFEKEMSKLAKYNPSSPDLSLIHI